MLFRQTASNEKEIVEDFYNAIIDGFALAEFNPGWQKGIYPTGGAIEEAIDHGEHYLGEWEGNIVAGVVLDHHATPGYEGGRWKVQAESEKIVIMHSFAVSSAYQGKGFGQDMLKEIIKFCKEKQQKSLRLDVLTGHKKARNVYEKIGFQHCGDVELCYDDMGCREFALYEYVLDNS